MGLSHALAKQLRRPSGWLGRVVGFVLRINRQGIAWTVGLLEIRPTDHVLEIGFGSGYGIQQAAALASRGRVAGIDFSEEMVRLARARNARVRAGGRVDLTHGDASTLPYPDGSFDKVFATNVVYFWQDPVANLKEARRVMKPGGRLALYVIAKEELVEMKITRTGVYTLYTGDELVRLLAQAGFRNARFETKSERFRTGVCALAEK
jgi:ubiquinone/menaquinone biosynthesis C-methylase UbiE